MSFLVNYFPNTLLLFSLTYIYKAPVTASIDPNSESIPRRMSIMQKTINQRFGHGRREIALGRTLNVKSGPSRGRSSMLTLS